MSTHDKGSGAARVRQWGAQAVRVGVTLSVVAAAGWAGWQLWDHYQLAPWTRDGRVRANVVQIAPDVSGLVTAVPVSDNQPVRADRKSTRLNSSHSQQSRMPSSA